MGGVTAILTAAGESTRMGCPKPLLPWRGVTLVEYQTASLLSGGVDEVIVVLGHEASRIEPRVKVPRTRCVVNRRYRRGKSTSVLAGLAQVPSDAEGILLLGVDQPRPPEIVAAVLDSHKAAGALITSPRYEGRGGHPLVFEASLRSELEGVTEEREGIRAVFRAHLDEVNGVAIDDPIVCLDLNTPEAYEEARERYGA